MLQPSDPATFCFMYYGRNYFDKEEKRSKVDRLRKGGVFCGCLFMINEKNSFALKAAFMRCSAVNL